MKPVRPNRHGIFPQVEHGVHDVALGNGTQYRIAVFPSKFGLFIGIVSRGCYEFTTWAHADYVRQKLGLGFDSDAGAVADFINDQLGAFDTERMRQGEYTIPRLLDN